MKKISFFILIFLMMLIGATNVSSAASIEPKTYDNYVKTTNELEKCVNIKVNATQNYTEAYKVFELVNVRRKERGLPELKLDKNLMDIAMQRAYEISVYYAHRRPEVYRNSTLTNPNYDVQAFVQDTLYRTGFYNKTTFLAENIAYNYTSSADVMDGWMNSTGHRNNILRTYYTTMGIGAIKTENGYFWVQIFGNDTYTKEEQRDDKTETRTIPVCKKYVNENEGYEGITLVANSNTINVGSTTKVKVKSSFLYSNAATFLDVSSFKWSSSNSKVLTVDQNGNVKGISAGNADVIITMTDGNTRTVNITVKEIPITGITLNKTSLTIKKGSTSALTTTILPINTTNSRILTWTSSDSSVATVDSIGRVTAKGSGTATITVKTSNGKTATCKITVPVQQTNAQTNTKPNTNINTQTITKGMPIVTYRTHVQNIGWQNYVKNGTMSGTSGKSLRLEGINIKLENNEYGGNIEYQTHVQNIGWQDYVKDGAMSGTSGQSLRLEGIRIKLTGDIANYYDVYYRVHCENLGWLDWAKNGEAAGSAGYSYRLEGIEISLVKKGEAAPGKTLTPFVQKYLTYQTHVQNVGWQKNVKDKDISGTSGQSLRLEGIKISLDNQPYSGNIEYRTHVQNIGWQDYVKNGAMSGTSGKSLRLEAIQIRLTGTMAEKYDIYYRVHCQNIGWMGWAKNGQSAGSAGYSYRLEAIQVCLIKKGESAPGSTKNCFVSK